MSLDVSARASRALRNGLSLPPRTLLAFIVAAAAIAVIALLSWRTLQNHLGLAEARQRVLAVLEGNRLVLSDLKDAETGQRGYLLTGETTYLEPYRAARTSLDSHLDQLDAALTGVTEETGHLQELRRLARDKLDEMDSTIRLQEAGRREDALAVVRTDRGRALMDRLREILGQQRTAQNTLLSERSAQVAAAVRASFYTVLGGLGVLMVVLWGAGLVTARDARVRETESWLRSGQAKLATLLQGELRPERLGELTLRFLQQQLGAVVGAFFVEHGARLQRKAALALDDSAPPDLAPGTGLAGETFTHGAPRFLEGLSEDHLRVTSASGSSRPLSLALVPTVDDGRANGLLELGFLRPINPADRELLERIAPVVGSAVGSAFERARRDELLEETQRQAEELQTQQEELRVANEELEEHGKILRESQARLETQHSELEETNAQLEEQTQLLAAGQEALQEKAAELARASQYKSEFLANMSHELRTPLNSTLILAKLLADNKNGNLDADQVRFAQTILSAGRDLLALINDILDLSKIEAGQVEVQPEPVEVQGLVEALVMQFEPIARERRLGFDWSIDAAVPPRVETDSPRVQQILRNLLSNALKFTERGGVRLRVDLSRGTEGDRLRFEVSDTGIGIEADKLDLIFEAFRQADGSTHRKYGGTGLGLSISRDLARLLGGAVTARSEIGVGSTFTLVLPLHFTPVAQGAAAAAAAPAVSAASTVRQRLPARTGEVGVADDRGSLGAHGGRTLLIIEDDQAFAQVLRDLARELQFDAVVAHTALDGLSAARRLPVTAIVLDMQLPDRAGLAVLDELKRDPRTRHIPVQVLSVMDYSHEALSRGAVGYDLKPIQRDELAVALERLAAQSTQRLRRILVVEDDARQREGMVELLGMEGIEIRTAATGNEALAQLRELTFDCMVLDLSLPDLSGYELLERMNEDETAAFPPVIVYTGRALSRDEELRLRRHSRSIIIKDARSPERLLDEVSLFLHKVESDLPADKQRLLRAARSREQVFDGRRVLVVEDDVRNIFAVSKVLEPLGLKVDIARNGREGVDLLERTAGSDEAPDLVLMDIMMPEMDGLTAMRTLRAQPRFRKLPIIALTAKAMPDDQQSCLAAGANDYIAKPLDVERLISLMRVWMPR